MPQGSVVTERMWWLALADRVTELVLRDPEPEQASKWACRALRVGGGDSPQEAGQFLVEGNSELRQNLRLQLLERKDPFPAEALVQSEQVREAMVETDLEMWINLAEPEMRSRSSDD